MALLNRLRSFVQRAPDVVAVLLLIVILWAGWSLRSVGRADWDGYGALIHPDEYHIGDIITTNLRVPDSFASYLRTECPIVYNAQQQPSLINPRNPQDELAAQRPSATSQCNSLNPRTLAETHVYGSWPTTVVRYVAEKIYASDAMPRDQIDRNRIVTLGRIFSSFGDLLVIVLLYVMGRRLANRTVGILAALFYAFIPFAIQQAHFYVVDSQAVAYGMLTLYFCLRIAQGGRWGSAIGAGVALAMAISSKINLAPMALMVIIAAMQQVWNDEQYEPDAWSPLNLLWRLWHGFWRGFPLMLVAGITTIIGIRFFMPDAFRGTTLFDVRPDLRFIKALGEAQYNSSGELDFPPSHQWAGRTNYVYELKNMIVWAVGVPLGITAWLSWLAMGIMYMRKAWRPTVTKWLVPWLWVTLYFGWQGGLPLKSMRYLLPIYGMLMLLAAWGLVSLVRWAREAQKPRIFRRVPLLYAAYGWSIAVVIVTMLWGWGFSRIYDRPHTRIQASNWARANIPPNSRVTWDNWDIGIPFLDGGIWPAIKIDITREDDPAKVEDLINTLNQADYLAFTSNRAYGSFPQLPMRFPMSLNYFNALFNGTLGFEKVADFSSYPSFLGIPIPDDLADEGWSVYDHPRVTIWRKTDRWNPDQARAILLDQVNINEIYKLKPIEATPMPTMLMLTVERWLQQRDAGSWRWVFDGFANRFALLAWLATIEILGIAAFGLLWRWRLPLADRGIGMARIVGLLLLGFGAWLPPALHLWSYSRIWIIAVYALIVAAGAFVMWRERQAIRAWFNERRQTFLTSQIVYFAFFLVLLTIRYLNPDLWHPAMGGEKPMNVAFLTATLKSQQFPPYDPWFAGGFLNYYYWGYVLVGTPMKLLGINPEIGFNLALPLLYGITAQLAGSIGYNAFSSLGRVTAKIEKRAIWLGVATAVAVVLLGNLVQVVLYFNGARTLANPAVSFSNPDQNSQNIWLSGGSALSDGIKGIAAALGDQDMPFRPEWPYWNATRVIPSTINEFPFFSYLYGDLHAHVIALPLTVLVLLLMLTLFKARRSSWLMIGSLGAALGLVVGALRATNIWDYPTYLALALITGIVVAWRRSDGVAWRKRWWLLAIFPVALYVVMKVAWQPFNQYLATGTADTLSFLADDIRMSLRDFVVMYGIWLWVIVPFMLRLSVRVWSFASNVVAWGGGFVWFLAVIAFSRRIVTRAVTPNDNKIVQFMNALIWKPLEQRGAVILIILPLFVIAVALLITALRHPKRLHVNRRETQFMWQQKPTKVGRIFPSELLPLALATAAFGLLMLTEVIVLPSAGRMNIVFKFGYQAWTLFAVASALALPTLWSGRSRIQVPFVRFVRYAWRGALVMLVLAGLFYPLTATQAKVNDRYVATAPRGFDGMAWMEGATWNEAVPINISTDAAAIRWLRANIEGTPTVLEASTSPYRWNARIATWTGLPTLIGWDGHENQQRAPAYAQGIVAWRKDVIQRIYTAVEPNTVNQLLDQYGVGVIYVGQLERAIYGGDAGLRVFEQLGDNWRKAYNTPDVQIFIRQTPAPVPDALPPIRKLGIPNADPIANVTLPTSTYLTNNKAAKNLPVVGGFNDWTWLSQHQFLAVIVWLLFFELIGFLAFPLAALALRSHMGAAWGFSKILGMILLGWLVWLPTSLGWWQWNRRSILLGMAVLTIAGMVAWRGGARRRVRVAWRTQRRAIISTELLFVGLFAVWTLIRALNPDLWHPFWGGEKPFEFGMVNAIIRSPQMPPVDPFYSGGTINYYYYGLYLMALPIKLLGLDPAIGFNLAVAIVGAMVGIGAWSVGLLITRKLRIAALSLIMVALIGNLASAIPAGWSTGVAGVVRAYQACEINPLPDRPCQPLESGTNFWDMLKDAAANGTTQGFGQRLSSGVPWFWQPSRVLFNDTLNTINEFPLWSVLFADLHPHLIALPITLLLIGLAWEASRRRRWRTSRITLAMIPFALGSLAAANAWDVPTYALLVILAFGLRGWIMREAAVRAMRLFAGRRDPVWRPIVAWLAAGVGIVVIAMVLYAPFFGAYHAPIGGIWPVRIGTPLLPWLTIYGLFLVVILGWLVLPQYRRRIVDQYLVTDKLIAMRSKWLLAYIPLALFIFVRFLVTEQPQTYRAILTASVPLRLLLIGMIAGLGQRLFTRILQPSARWALILALLGALVGLGMESVFIRDHLSPPMWEQGAANAERMNTVFKFGYQVWVLWALAAALILPRLMRGLRRTSSLAYGLWTGIISILFACTLVFPIFGTISRISTRFDQATGMTLDGLAFMQTARYSTAYGEIALADDLQAIRWLNQNVKGTPTVLQSEEEFYRTYGIRIAANTGLPTIVSALHSNEQRPPDIVAQRISDAQTIYNSADSAQTIWLLNKYKVDYVYLGQLERLRYPNAVTKFASLPGLQQVYQQGNVTIYKTTADLPNLALQWRRDNPVPPPVSNTPPPQGGNEAEQAVANYEADPNNAGKAFEAGRLLWQAGQPDRAAAILRRAADLHPDDIGVHHLLGDVLLSVKRYAEGVQAYEEGFAAGPTPQNQTKLGTGYLAWAEVDATKLTDAERAFKGAIEKDANLPDAYYFLGETYRLLGLVDEAKVQYQEYLNRAPADAIWVNSARERLK